MSLQPFSLTIALFPLIACTSGTSNIGSGDDADVVMADAVPISDDGNVAIPDAAPAEDPHVRWGGAATGCPRPSTITGTEVFSGRIDLRWNDDVSIFQERGATSLAVSATPVFKQEYGGLATLVPQVATVAIASQYLNVGLSRVVYVGARSVDDVSYHPERVCLEGVAGAETSGGVAATVVYTDALTVDSHISGTLVTVVLGANDGIVLTYPATAQITIANGLTATAATEVLGGSHQRRLGTGSSTAYMSIISSAQIQVVPDQR